MQQVTRTILSEGVGLTCVTTAKFKRAVLRVVLLLPLGGEDAALRAVLPQVLRRGTRTLPDLRAIGAALDEKYGARIESAVRKEGETLAVGFLSDCIDEACAPGADGLTASVIELLAALLYDPCLTDGAFRADYTAAEQQNLLDRIAAQKNDPRAYAPKRLTELMCADEVYGLSALGTAEQAEQITPQALYAAYRRALDEARIELFYCGTMQPEAVASLFAAALPARLAQAETYTPHTVVRARPAEAAREIVEEEPVGQGKLSLGFRTGGASLTGGDPVAYWLFQTVYGGSTSAKLFLNVREKKSLCYYASAQFMAHKGLLLVNSGIENKDFAVARDEILHQLALCRQGDITGEELAAARAALMTGWRAMLDDPLALERYWLAQAVAGTQISPEARIEQVRQVTQEAVVQAARDTTLDTVYFMKGAGK